MKIEIDTQTGEVKFNGKQAGRLEDLRYRPSLMTTQVAGSAADVIQSGEAENMYLELRLSGFAVRDAGGAP
jgi:hypothetical protein